MNSSNLRNGNGELSSSLLDYQTVDLVYFVSPQPRKVAQNKSATLMSSGNTCFQGTIGCTPNSVPMVLIGLI